MEKSPPPTTTTGNNAILLLGKYKLGRLLGRGAFAKVYYAKSIIDGSIVAIKVIDKSKIKNNSMESRIIGEITAMHRLNHHPNIIKIHEVMATKTKIYIVMEYAKGGELLSKITRHGRLSESKARLYFQQLVAALHFCHVNGIAHRDLKPQNLLLDHNGNLKISDFGLSALPEQLRSDGLLHTACGTPAYTAPEVIGRRGYVGNKSDAWSCGVVLFVLLAGDIPFDDTNIVVMYHKILRKEYVFPSWFSKTVRGVIMKLLDPNPITRMSIEELMDVAWFNKSLKTIERPSEHQLMLLEEDKDNGRPTVKMVNAFDIISMSSGLDLSAIFEESRQKEERWGGLEDIISSL